MANIVIITLLFLLVFFIIYSLLHKKSKCCSCEKKECLVKDKKKFVINKASSKINKASPPSSFLHFKIEGMSCTSCATRIEKITRSIPGVKEAVVDLFSNTMSVKLSAPGASTPTSSNPLPTKEINEIYKIKVHIIEEVIHKTHIAGYKATYIVEDKVKEEEKEALNDGGKKAVKQAIRRLLPSLLLLIPLLYLTLFHALFNTFFPPFLTPTVNTLLQLVLSFSILLINKVFFVSGVKAALARSPNMDTLISAGSAISFLWSLILTIKMLIIPSNLTNAPSYTQYLYYESSAMIVVFVSIGKTLEAYTKGKTTSALKSLTALIPNFIERINKDTGEVEKVTVDSIECGDEILVKSGEVLALDGVLLSKVCTLDASSITGESIPIDKKCGDVLLSGSIVLGSAIKVKVTKSGEDTTIKRIIALTKEATLTKAPLQKVADRVSSYFIPSVFLLSLITFIAHLLINGTLPLTQNLALSLRYAVSVIVISCPCALGLATPASIMVGTGKAARAGILFKTASVLENSSSIKVLAFDKTGTLTEGKLSISNIIVEKKNCAYLKKIMTPYSMAEDNKVLLLELASLLEQFSTHPIATCILSAVTPPKNSINIQNFLEVAGEGVRATISKVDNKGNKEENNYFIEVKKLSSSSPTFTDKTAIQVVADGKELGVISFTDKLKPDAKSAIEAIKKCKITPILISGDNEEVTKKISAEAGIEKYYCNTLPENKAFLVKELKKEVSKNGLVAMCGDGINDSAALAASDIGISMANGADIARQSSDIILLNNKVRAAINAIKIGKSVKKNIKQNLFFSLIYNLLCIPLAAGALSHFNLTLTPEVAAAAMSASSVCVVLNALRLNFIKVK